MSFITDLQCQDPVIYELMQEEEVSPYQLISAQLQVIKSMEENWYVITAVMAAVLLSNVAGFRST